MSFTPVVMHKAGHADEVADDPEQVAQYLWDGWTRGTPPVPPKTTSQLLADKADLVSGRVPDAQLPARLGQTELRAAFGAVPWIGGEAITAGMFRLSPTGQIIQRNADGTTRPSYDATEIALWTVRGGTPYTDEQAQDAAAALFAAGADSGIGFTYNDAGNAENASVLPGAGALPFTATKTAAYTAAAGEIAVMNVAGGATTLTLPTAPANKALVGARSLGSTTAVPLTITRGGADTIGESGATSVTEPLAGVTRIYQYDAANTRWLPVSDVKPLAALDGIYLRVVQYAGDLNTARPPGATAVYWSGFPATPTNALSADIVATDGGGLIDTGIRTFDSIPSSGGATMGSANRISYHRVKTGGTITKIGLQVVVQSGNVGVSVHGNTGTGAGAMPGALKGSSGIVTCPAVGYVELSLGGSVIVAAGDWLSIWTDNVTASFLAVGSAQDATAKWGGLHAFQNSATPNPNPAAATVGLIRGYELNGVA